MSRESKLKNSIEWFNQLEDKMRRRIVYLIEIDGIFRLEKEEIEKIKVFSKFIINEIENAIEEETIINKLVKAGLENEYAEILLEFSQGTKIEYMGSNIINNMDITDFKKIVEFIVNKSYLYREINFIPFEEFTEKFKFKNEIEAKSVIILINTYSNSIIERDLTIENAKDILVKVNEVDTDYVEAFMKIIIENLQDLRMANMMFKLNKIESKMEEFKDLFQENIEIDESSSLLIDNE